MASGRHHCLQHMGRVGRVGVRVGGQASMSTNELDTLRPAPEWMRSLFLDVYLLFSAVQSDLSVAAEMFTGGVRVALGFNASLVDP